ncbi:hypothetical protein BJY00DRAFT_105807 [Aspergillus carlsbadensis]|nr:hypothetical protein BJY00DRAFT_105807 [Aspergillus carlsbadensis]
MGLGRAGRHVRRSHHEGKVQRQPSHCGDELWRPEEVQHGRERESWIQELIMDSRTKSLCHVESASGSLEGRYLLHCRRPLLAKPYVDPFFDSSAHHPSCNQVWHWLFFALKFAMFQFISFPPLPSLQVSPSLRLRILPFLRQRLLVPRLAAGSSPICSWRQRQVHWLQWIG